MEKAGDGVMGSAAAAVMGPAGATALRFTPASDPLQWRPALLRSAGPGRWALANITVALFYCTLGWAVSQFFSKYGIFPSPIWLPSSIAVIAAMLGGWRMFPGIFAGSLVANYALFDPTAIEAVAISVGNALGPLVAVAALARLRPEAGLFNRLRGVVAFIACAIILHPAISAAGGTLTLHFAEGLPTAALPGVWIKWWLSDSGGTLFFAPALMLWLNMEREAIPRSDSLIVRDPVFWVLVGLSGALLVVPLPIEGAIRWSSAFLLVVPLTWIALRISLRAAYTLISIVSVIASAGAVAGFGPLHGEGVGNPMQLAGVLVVLLALNVLTVIALVAERRAAEEANRLKSMRLASASHDLRTPLNAIIGFSDVMKNQVLGPIETPRYREYVDHIYDSAHVLLDIIDDILDLSRIEAGRHDIAPELLDAGALARSCVEIVSIKAEAGGVKLSLEAGPDATVFADQRALRQILLNLMTNAVKFTPGGGTVTVRVAPASRREIVFAVTDTGIGMSAEDIEVALQPFGRIAQNGVPSEKGTGLGLPIAQRLAELHGGRLTIDSKPGKGTTIRVILPSVARPLGEDAGEPPAAARGGWR